MTYTKYSASGNDFVIFHTFLEKDYTPDPDEGVEFKQVTMEEFRARTDELIKDPYYF